jgi:DNA-binding CsgD family transcriptional regulator
MNGDAVFRALGRLVAEVGRKDFGNAAFDLVDQGIRADHLVITLIGRADLRSLLTKGRLPARVADTLNRRYLERYHLLDQSLPSLWDVAGETPAVLPYDHRLRVSPTYHAFFFENARLCDKLSIVNRRDDCLMLCNLYRLAESGPFAESDLAHARTLALPLTAAAWLHADKVAVRVATEPRPRAARNGADEALHSLTRREMDVCRRLLVGASNEGVALDLSISTHTVRTLRKRIYRKLEVSSLTDLFSKYRHLVAVTDRPL